jgi:hypothetical protein
MLSIKEVDCLAPVQVAEADDMKLIQPIDDPGALPLLVFGPA